MADYPPHHPSYRKKGYLPNFARASRPDLKHERKQAMTTRHHKGHFDADFDVVQLGDTFEDLPVLDFQAMNKKANADGLMADVERIREHPADWIRPRLISGRIIANIGGKPHAPPDEGRAET